jgi:hypothetical protein
MTGSREEFSSLNHFGNGPQVGRDFNGNVTYEQLDPESRAALKQLSKDTPALNHLLEEALRDGLISPELVQALQNALNEDVLHVLWVVGRHLNEDVAMEFATAARTITRAATQELPNVTRELSNTMEEIKTVTETLRAVSGHTSTNIGAASRNARVVSLPVSRIRDNWWFVPTVMSSCCGTGLVAAVILMHSHLERYALFVGIPLLVLASLPWTGYLRR